MSGPSRSRILHLPMPVDYQQPPAEVAQVQPAAGASFEQEYERARTLANTGQPALALAAYDALLARSPGNVDVLLGRGIVLSRLERWSEAEADEWEPFQACRTLRKPPAHVPGVFLWSA